MCIIVLSIQEIIKFDKCCHHYTINACYLKCIIYNIAVTYNIILCI